MQNKIIVVLAFALALLLLLIANGCAPNERVIYKTVFQDVNVPVACDIDRPVLNVRNNDEALDMADIAEYVGALESAWEACTGETLK